MTKGLELSVIIETLNYERGDEEILGLVLAALGQQTMARREIEIIVVVDPDRDREMGAHLLAMDGALRIIEAPGAHYHAQKNRGAEAARADIVAFLDSDCRPCATWAETMVRHLRGGRPDLAGVQGTLTTDRTIQGLSFAVASFAQVQGRVARETAMLTGNNCPFRRAEFLADPFDEAPWFHGPEVKKIAALRHAGQHVMLDPGAEVRHAFYPGLTNFLTFSVYWGWCFLHLRRGNPTGVAYAGLFDGLGWLAPFFLAPAKMAMDTRRLIQQRRNMDLSWVQTARCCLFLYAMAPAIAYGGILERLKREPPTPLY